MKKYNIVYIDESEDDIQSFQYFAHKHFNLDTKLVTNDSKLEYLVEEIISSNVDAVITDFMLNETARVAFNGQDLIDAIRKKNKRVPCFLLTSHAPDALNAATDALCVQAKVVPFGGNGTDELKVHFRAQVAKAISIYRDEYAQTLEEFEELVNRKPETMSAMERQRLVELDNLLESYGGADFPIPDELKDGRALRLLAELVAQVDKVLEGVKK
ncbi:hypothetical protein [Achromobacter sp. ACRQX]|uniref:hypothetical protein n=1 Tax=Achromobacter sp. ACRQX TaxID=2918181 RepID=UPI001EF39AE4|nr:hypothetical protein [Achromobacter sp. ACRQX]MCG7323844.1 hypothetical protein [Achromobacter sp. ACRQX]